MNLNDFEIENTECEQLLRIRVDCKLNFKNYLDGVIKNSSNKVNTFLHHPWRAKKRMLTNFFFEVVIQLLFTCFSVS